MAILVDHVEVRERIRTSGARELQIWLLRGPDLRLVARVAITQADGKPAPFVDQVIAVDRAKPWRTRCPACGRAMREVPADERHHTYARHDVCTCGMHVAVAKGYVDKINVNISFTDEKKEPTT